MSDTLARARESAVLWLEGYDPEDGDGPLGAKARDPLNLFTTECVLDAYMGGVEYGANQAAGTRCGVEPFAIPAVIAANGDLVPVDPREQRNIRPVTTGPMADAGVIDSLVEALGGPAHSLSSVKSAAFHLQTADPRFDPAEPVLINGFRFTPATEK